MADLSAFKIDMKIIKSIVDISRVNFMGFLHKIFLYDVSTSCRIGLVAIKSLMAKRTSEKIHILQKGEEEVLNEWIDRSQRFESLKGDVPDPKHGDI